MRSKIEELTLEEIEKVRGMLYGSRWSYKKISEYFDITQDVVSQVRSWKAGMPDPQIEVWKTIPNYPRYEVSNFGRIRNEKGEKLHPYLPVPMCRKVYVNLYGKEGEERFPVDVLVLTTFGYPRPGEGYQVCHKKGREDNRLENLYWTHSRF